MARPRRSVGDIVYATDTDLARYLIENAAKTSWTLLLGNALYQWPAGVVKPQGLSIKGVGYNLDGLAFGSRIQSTGRIIQETGTQKSCMLQDVAFLNGFQATKHHVTALGCYFGGEGLKVGDSVLANSPYYSAFFNCKYRADTGGNSITTDLECNAVYFHGSVYVPRNGRGIYMQRGVGNKFDVALDLVDAGDPMSTDIGSMIYIGGATQWTEINIFYFENRFPANFRDGAHIVFADTAFGNKVFVPARLGRLRVKNTNDTDNHVTSLGQEGTFRNSNFSWTYTYPTKVLTGAATSVNLPPTFMRQGGLTLLSEVAVTLNQAYVVSVVSVNAAGSGGTDGTYYQQVTDGNVVTDMFAQLKITVAGGVMTAVELLYGGWFTAAGAATVNVAAATGLTGGIVNLTWAAHTVDGRAALVVNAKDPATLLAKAQSTRWRIGQTPPVVGGTASLSPDGSGEATIAHGQTVAPTAAHVNLVGDVGNVFVDVRAISATLITVRFKDGSGADVTTGGPYSVSWMAK